MFNQRAAEQGSPAGYQSRGASAPISPHLVIKPCTSTRRYLLRGSNKPIDNIDGVKEMFHFPSFVSRCTFIEGVWK
jgi:hypothetical protein